MPNPLCGARHIDCAFCSSYSYMSFIFQCARIKKNEYNTGVVNSEPTASSCHMRNVAIGINLRQRPWDVDAAIPRYSSYLRRAPKYCVRWNSSNLSSSMVGWVSPPAQSRTMLSSANHTVPDCSNHQEYWTRGKQSVVASAVPVHVSVSTSNQTSIYEQSNKQDTAEVVPLL